MTYLRKLSVFLLVMTTLLLSLSVQAANPTPRIVGGNIVPDDQFPFMAALYFYSDAEDDFFFGCGGSFITRTWVITAAHCVVNSTSGITRPAGEVVVRAGARDIAGSDEGVFVRAQNIIVHPSYDIATSASDIALIELSEAVNQSIIVLPAEGSNIPMVDERAIVAGWGNTSEGGSLSNELQAVVVPIIPHAQCLGNYPYALNSNANVCAGVPSGGIDSCQGDSGGPLFVVRDGVYVQAGVVSFGHGCARPTVPGVYTRMSSYTSWVASHVPNVQINETGLGVFNPDENIGEMQLTPLNAAAPIQTGVLQFGTYMAYDIGNASRVRLRSQTGDADLYIFDKARLESDQSVCRPSTVIAQTDESCVISASAEGHIAVVFTLKPEPTEFRISLSNADDPLEDDPTPSTTFLGSSSGGSMSVSVIALLASLVLLRRRKPTVV